MSPTDDSSLFIVPLVPAARAALSVLLAKTGLSRTDIANRSLQLYALLELEKSRGAEVCARNPDGTIQTLSWADDDDTGMAP